MMPEKLPDREGDQDEAAVLSPEIRKARPRTRVFIEGDDFFAELGAVADALFQRGNKRLGSQTLRWLQDAEVPRGAHVAKNNRSQ
jgi:hypothetical protein